MKNTVHYKLCIVIAVISINLMLDQVSATSQKAADKNAKNVADLAEKIQIIIFKGNSIGTADITKVPITQTDVLYENLDPDEQLVIYVHGFHEAPSYKNTQTVVGAYLKCTKSNIWSFDWSKLSFLGYGRVVKNAKIIAQVFAIALTKLIHLGLNIDSCHIVGHSLGAQISGLVYKYFDYDIPRITALDAAGPGFSHRKDEHINNQSAIFVDVIHTDRGFYGFKDRAGTVDFYPNDGRRPQPGCPLLGGPILTPKDLCSHWRSWQFYAESVCNVNAFLATQCDCFEDYLDGECSDNRVISMGYGAPSDACGTYYLTTRKESPYGENYSD